MNRRKGFFVGCVFLVLAIGLFFPNTAVFAQELIPGAIRADYDLGGMQAFAESSERWLRVIYIIIRPMLALAGAAMDNSLVYGEAFFLTPALFKFWNIIRTFANFALGFYFLWKILSAFFNNKLEAGYFSLVKKTFIAGVLINFSWSIIAGLIDISTIATVSLGGIPIHALQSDAMFKDNIYYLKTHANLNLNDANAEKADRFDFSILYSCYPGANASSGSAAEGTKQGGTTGGTAAGETLYYLPCAINNQQLYPSGSASQQGTRENRKENFVSIWKKETKIDTTKIQDAYCVYNNKLIANEYGANIGECKVLQDLMVKGKKYGVQQCAHINDLITRSRYYTGPLFAMYTSIINVADMGVTTTSGSLKQIGLTLMLKLITLGALLVPLIAFAVVMIIRVIYIWMIIIFSPLIVLVMTLERGESVGGKIDGAVKNIFNAAEVVKLILLPAITTFALSISIIFLTLLHNLPLIESEIGTSARSIKPSDGCRNDTITALSYDRKDTPEGTMYDFGTFEINLAESLRRTGADIGNILSWLGLNGLGIALMRMVVFAALKSSEFTKGVVDSIESTAKSIAGTVPIIPIGNGKAVGIDALKQAPKDIKNKLVNAATQQQTDILNDFQKKTFGQEKSVLNKEFEEAAKTPEGKSGAITSGLNSVPIPQGTDLTDYASAPKVFAKQAQTWFNKQPDPKNPGKMLGENQEIKNSLAGISSWESALQNPHFIKWMHDDKNNNKGDANGYDAFLPTWDQRSKGAQDEQYANMLENGMKAMVKNNEATEIKNPVNKYTTGYQYLDKITIFERDPKTGMLVGNKTQSRTINKETKDVAQITESDVQAFNALMEKKFTLPDNDLFTLLGQKNQPRILQKLKIKGGKVEITTNIDASTNTITGYTITTPTSPTPTTPNP